jgi:protein arginine kinase
VLLGLIGDVKIADINSLLVRTQPAHLQKIRGVELDTKDRNIERARYLRQHFEAGNSAGGASVN